VSSVVWQGRLKEAVEAYEKALAGAPNFDIVRTNLAIAIAELATYTKSKGACEVFTSTKVE
jgi:protein O-GlcNAc transferase